MSVGDAHTTVLLNEAVGALAIKPEGIYVDGTFGRGGHSARILECLGNKGRLIALDKDPAAVAAGNAWRDARFQMVHRGFAHLAEVLRELGVQKVDGILLDLGVSSPQLDDAARGFSFRFDAPLDMRMDTSGGMTAAQWLAGVDESLLTEVIRITARNGLLSRFQERLLRRAQSNPSKPRGNSSSWLAKRYVPVRLGRTRRHAPFKLYGFISIRSLKSLRGCYQNV